MFGPTRYLTWARRFFGKIEHDLATSGLPTASATEVGLPDLATLDDPSGWEQLRAAIARYNDVPAAEAVAALGTTHALWLAYTSLLSPGDEVIVETPVYEPLVRIAEGLGARVAYFERDPRDGFAIDPERVARAITPRTRVIAVTNLHNPTGVRTPDATLAAVARLAESAGAHLVVDEVYAPFDSLVDERGVFGGSARKLAPNVVTVSSLTKCYGLSPHRIGWMLGPADVMRRAEDAVTASCGMAPLSHAHIALRAFERIGPLAARARALVAGKRERVTKWVEAAGLSWSAPAEGLFGFVTMPGAGDLTPRIEKAALERGVLVAAGAFFGVPNGFRLAWSAPSDTLDEGLSRLADVLR